MNDKAAAEFRLEPRRFWRHDFAGIGDIHDLFHRDRIECQSHLHLAAVHAAFQFAEATETADEVDALVFAKVLDAEDFVENQARGDADIEDADRIAVVVGALMRAQAIPFAVEIEREFVELRSAIFGLAHAFDIEVLFERLEEFRACEAIEVFDDAVIIEDRELAGLEADSHEIIIFFVAAMIWVLSGFFGADERGGSRAMMAVRDIERRHLGEFRGDQRDISGIFDQPELVTETVNRRDEIIFWRRRGIAHDQVVEHAVVGIGEEDGLDVRVVDADMFHAVFFFVGAGQLMFFDDAVHIIGDISAHDKAVLRLAVHGLCIDIIHFLIVLDQPAFVLEHLEMLCRAFIYTGIIFARAGLEIDFGLDDMIERHLVVAGFRACFFRIEHIVWTAFHFFDEIFGRTNAFKRFNDCHI